jgi:hypothetical protein
VAGRQSSPERNGCVILAEGYERLAEYLKRGSRRGDKVMTMIHCERGVSGQEPTHVA